MPRHARCRVDRRAARRVAPPAVLVPRRVAARILASAVARGLGTWLPRWARRGRGCARRGRAGGRLVPVL